MRIGIDGHVLTGKHQGIRTTLLRLLQALGPHAGEHEFIIYSHDPESTRALVGVSAFRYAGLLSNSPAHRLLSEFPRLFRRDEVDFGVFQYISPLHGNNLVFVHDILPLSHPHLFPALFRLRSKLMFSLTINRAARVAAVSNYTGGEIASRFRSARGRLSIVLNGPSFPREIYFRETRSTGMGLVLTVGRIERRKNVPLLIEAFLQADVPDTRLVIVGVPDMRFKFQRPKDSRIEIRASTTEAELIALYRQADLFIYPSCAEGFGLPLLDATLFGIPAIASDKTAIPEVGGDLPWYFDPDRPEALRILAGRIRDHFSTIPVPAPTYAQRLKQAERFSWDEAARSLLKVIRSLSPMVVMRDS